MHGAAGWTWGCRLDAQGCRLGARVGYTGLRAGHMGLQGEEGERRASSYRQCVLRCTAQLQLVHRTTMGGEQCPHRLHCLRRPRFHLRALSPPRPPAAAAAASAASTAASAASAAPVTTALALALARNVAAE